MEVPEDNVIMDAVSLRDSSISRLLKNEITKELTYVIRVPTLWE